MSELPRSWLRRSGQVLQSSHGVVTVSLTGSCGACANPCLAGLRQGAAPALAIASEKIRAPGSSAEVVLERSGFTRSCALVFGLPLLGLLAGAVAGDWFAEQIGNIAAAQWGALAGAGIAVVGVVARRRMVQRWIMLGLGEATQHTPPAL